MKSRLLLIAFLGVLCFEGYGQTLSAGDMHSLGLKEDGTVVAWGHDGYGKGYDAQVVPYGIKGVIAVSAGASHSLVLKEDRTVVAWGSNKLDVPQGLKGVIAISAGSGFSLALKEDGTVVAWGSNKLDVPQGLKGVIAISAGGSFALALKEDGTVVAWGLNHFGQCDVPLGLKGVIAISAGSAFALALKEDGTGVAWGRNDDGQCDLPLNFKRIIAISASLCWGVALKDDGTVVVWGSNIGNTLEVPPGLKEVIAISAGDMHSLALKEDGTVVAWGTSQWHLCEVPDGLILLTNLDSNKLVHEREDNYIVYNSFYRDASIGRVFIVGNIGEDCFGNSTDGQDIATLAETLLLGEYDILERKYFEQILDEQRRSASGLITQETSVELGCNVGAQGIIFAETGCLDGIRTVNLKLVGCQTSEIYWSCLGIGTTALKTVQRVKEELSK